MNRHKIRVAYPDGKIECSNTVAKTFRNAIVFMGLERVRSLNEYLNKINIVSTIEEAANSKGKKKESLTKPLTGKDGTRYIIATQNSTEVKYRLLTKFNNRLNSGLKITLEDENCVNKVEQISICVPEEQSSQELTEGLLKEYNLRRYERNSKARELCLEHYGHPYRCQVCGFDFEKTYGKRDIAEPYIEVHHINPHSIASANGVHTIDCTKDLIPVCANCHRMLHHLKKELISPDELKGIIEKQR